MPRYAQIARLTGASASDVSDEVAAAALPEYLRHLNARLGIGRLRDFIKAGREVFEQKLPAMAEAALASGSPQNNPVVPTAAEIIELYRHVW
jgi:alcohol dehydrogenase class IV